MVSKTLFVLAVTASAASAFVTPQQSSPVARPATSLSETFGLGLGEDTYENQPDFLKGEQDYKTWMAETTDNSFVNRQYALLRRVRELDLLGKTVDGEVLSSLEAQGLDLKKLEELLPAIEEAGLLSLVANNQQLLINGVAPLAVEGAPLILPVLAGALDIGAPAFFLAAAACAGAEGTLIANNVEIPFVGLPASVLLGLLFVPLTVVFGGVGVFFSGLKK